MVSRISSKLREAADGKLMFWCPGCDGPHAISVGEGPGPRWTWDGNADAPTFKPSLLVRFPHWVPPATPENPNPPEQQKVEAVCHSWVRGGRMEFLGDCTHALKGQTVEIPDWDSA